MPLSNNMAVKKVLKMRQRVHANAKRNRREYKFKFIYVKVCVLPQASLKESHVARLSPGGNVA